MSQSRPVYLIGGRAFFILRIIGVSRILVRITPPDTHSPCQWTHFSIILLPITGVLKELTMAKGYLDLMKQARVLAEKDIHGIVGKLQELGQHFPDLVDQAVGAITRTGERIKAATKTTAVPAAAAPVTKKKKWTKLTQAESQELRNLLKKALKGKVKQIDFIEKFLADHPKYKASTVQNVIADFRAKGEVKAEPVSKGNSKAGIYLMPGK
jgi:hypothetical protein